VALVFRAGIGARLAVLLVIAGCSLPQPTQRADAPLVSAAAAPQQQAIAPPRQVDAPAVAGAVRPANSIQQVVHRLPTTVATAEFQDDDLFAAQPELSLSNLLAEVEARNPSLQAMVYAWRAMAQRYPQVVSLDDPMFMTMMAPASFGSNQVESAYILSASQKLPWFGKRDARGRQAQAEASAAFQDSQDTRLQVAQVTRLAFYDYYLVERENELNAQNESVMREFRDNAQAKFENFQVTKQDVLQADVELTNVERRQIELDRMRRVAVARINTLLRRAPQGALPPPPRRLPLAGEPTQAADLQQIALTQRPDLAALAARVRAEEAALNLALKQYYPDTEVFGRYDSFWQPASTQSDLRGQVGVNVNVPIYRRKLQAAVCEAQFRLSQRRAEYEQRATDIQYEVQAAHAEVEESRLAAELFAQKYLPLAEQNVAVARDNYDVGKINFLFLAEAQRQLISLREKYQQTLTDYHRRVSILERAVGGPLPAQGRLEDLPVPATRNE
jgi:outer membrane protein, heavy metal efflux system